MKKTHRMVETVLEGIQGTQDGGEGLRRHTGWWRRCSRLTGWWRRFEKVSKAHTGWCRRFEKVSKALRMVEKV